MVKDWKDIKIKELWDSLTDNQKNKVHSSMVKMTEKKTDVLDPLLDGRYNRYAIFPIQCIDIWDAYKTHEASIWHAQEIMFDAVDDQDWGKLTDGEKFFLEHVLAFFASSDGVVADNASDRFRTEVQIPEATFFYDFQTAMENIHSETYSLLIDHYIKNKERQLELFKAVEKMPCIAQKIKWAEKWQHSNRHISVRLVAFAIVEGIFFSGSFCAIYWMNSCGKLPALSHANELIARDEGMHTDFACLLYKKYITNKLYQKEVEEILSEAVNIEVQFITEALPCKLLGMNSNNMIKYIKYCANGLMEKLGHDPSYDAKEAEQPFSFMDRISLSKKVNFFERESAQYNKGTHTKKKQETIIVNMNDFEISDEE